MIIAIIVFYLLILPLLFLLAIGFIVKHFI